MGAGTLQRGILANNNVYDRPGNKLNGMEWNGTTGAGYITEPQIDHQAVFSMCSPSDRTSVGAAPHAGQLKAPQQRREQEMVQEAKERGLMEAGGSTGG